MGKNIHIKIGNKQSRRTSYDQQSSEQPSLTSSEESLPSNAKDLSDLFKIKTRSD